MLNSILTFLSPIIVAALAAVFVALLNRKFDYQCENCGQIFSLPILVALFAPHSMGKKLVTCPICGERTWVSPVLK